MAALEQGDIESATLPDAEKALLRFAAKVTCHAYRVTADDTDQLRQAGWTDPQIAEAVYICGLFALFNRVADAFGLKDPKYRETPTVASE